MTWNSYAKIPRLEKALLYCGLNPRNLDIVELVRKMDKRGAQDKVLNPLVGDIISILEPPSCQKAHCENFGGQGSFCNCSIGRVPGRCKDHKEFLQRRKERKADWIERAMTEALCFYPEKVVGKADWEQIWSRDHRTSPEEAVRNMADKEGRPSCCEGSTP